MRAALRIALLALPALLLGLHDIDASDVWFHLATGDLIARTGSLPERDPFSAITPPGRWIVHDWLAGVVFHGLWRMAGPAGLVLLVAGLVTAALILPLVLAIRARESCWPYEVALLLATFIAYERFFVRPEAFTIFLAALWVQVLARGGPRTWRGAVGLAATQVFWTNVHAGFVIGPALAAAAAAGEAARRLRPGTTRAAAPYTRLLLPVLALLACCVTPYGAGLLAHAARAYRELGTPELRRSIVEWQPTFSEPVPGDLVLMLFVAGLAGLGAAAWFGRGRLRLLDLAIVAGTTFLACTSRRHLALWAVTALPLAAGWVAGRRGAREGIGENRNEIGGNARRGVLALAPRVATGALSLLLAGSIARGDFYRRCGPPRVGGLGVAAADHPIGAGDFVARSALPGPLYNNLAAGSYLVWRLRGEPGVLVDGRLLHPDLFRQYRRTLEAPAAFDAFAAEHGTRLVVLALRPYPPASLFRYLHGSSVWRLVFLDGEGAVFVRADVLAERGDLVPLRLEEPLPAAPAAVGRPGRWWRACDPGEAARRGDMLQRLGFPAAAQSDLVRALAYCPDRWDIGLQLGSAWIALGEAARAEPLLLRGLEHDPRNAAAWVDFGACRAALGDTAGARMALEQARTLAPADPRVRQALRALGSR
jgi:hypothetical protein